MMNQTAFFVTILIGFAVQLNSAAEEPKKSSPPANAPFVREQSERVKKLIETLASKNAAPPIRGPSDDAYITFPKETYDQDLQIPVYLAIQQLVAEGEIAVDLLLSHPNDERYSFSVKTVGPSNLSVSSVCQLLAEIPINCFKPELEYITYDQEFVYPKLGPKETFADWWAKNKHRGLAALQLEAIDANLAFFRTVDGEKARGTFLSEGRLPIDEFNECREKNKRVLEKIRAVIIAGNEAYQPKTITRLQRDRNLIGLPWTPLPVR